MNTLSVSDRKHRILRIGRASAKHVNRNVSPHAIEPNEHFAVVVILVPKIKHGQNDQRGYESSHVSFPSLAAPALRTGSADRTVPPLQSDPRLHETGKIPFR